MVDEHAAGLRAAGFVTSSDFDVPALRVIGVRLMVDPNGMAYASIVEHLHSAIGTHAEIVSRFDDGTRLFVSSTNAVGQYRHPQHVEVRLPGATMQALVARSREERAGKAAIVMDTMEAVVHDWEEAFAKEFAWQKSQFVRR